ncbi:MAG: glycoside hydrolase family 95 protein [Bacteroidia bacterium]|nr:glycoside hydrolase family 95 protein [Bacteroidia bacterium]
MMSKTKLVIVALCTICCLSSAAQDKDIKLWYKSPAKTWTEALPVGNGRLGGMVFGDFSHERIQLNEESVWAGSKINNNNPRSKAHLGEIQQAIFRGEYKKALELSNKFMLGTPPQVRSYQPLGDLIINFGWKGQPLSYKRSLTLNTGISKTEYTIDGNKVTQEVFASAPQNIIVISLSATKAFNSEILLSRECDTTYEFMGKKNRNRPVLSLYSNDYFNTDGLAYFTGQIVDEDSPLKGPGGKHLRYSAAMKILSLDGTSSPCFSDTSAGFRIISAKNIVIVLTGATDYNIDSLNFDRSINPFALCKDIILKASEFTSDELKQIHEVEHRSVFDRVEFSLGEDTNKNLATDERLSRVKEGNTDNGLIALYYQYGRYLLMGSSRKPGRLPANLQGIWNDLYEAPWNSDFHTNINLQMNYWPAETGNLSETSVVLSDFMSRLTVPGAATASEMYNAKGWTIHHLTDPYGRTGVADGAWGITPLDGPWMTFPVYEHFEFSSDTVFLQNVAYPMIKGSVEFVLDYLVKSPDGYLVTNPSHSPENSFFVPNTDRKEKSQLTYAPTVDIHIINALFNNFINAAQILDSDPEMVEKVREAQKQLPPLKVSPNGSLQEWIQDFEEVEPGHRHMSHLLGLYPLNLISPKEPELFEAAGKTLERRLAGGGGHTGWSRAWIICFYARLLDSEKANEHLYALLRKSTLNNLFDTHPPFQIDGNFGGTAGIAEMLLQSQNGDIHLLPALPSSWPAGSIHGLRARGACTVNLDWKEGLLSKVSIRSDKGGSYTIRYKEKTKQIHLKPGEAAIMDGSLIKKM